ncbi:hypothetical protein HYPSUDRAFT_209689 [Hypholoma sublateritium FD-334 SS-4]|uniref:Uncharacterized protein n=1 Tax=Hypholoma sublateritium (strain FD-334 SS-4) TaxID=945553 RepID=A0A0D2NXR7_HYPSF|nr:hypothetical protein HYPSUDRAFT_209689 [Hypholoma sublateritium FD-334 SS-4]
MLPSPSPCEFTLFVLLHKPRLYLVPNAPETQPPNVSLVQSFARHTPTVALIAPRRRARSSHSPRSLLLERWPVDTAPPLCAMNLGVRRRTHNLPVQKGRETPRPAPLSRPEA